MREPALAEGHALERLESELSPLLHYHSVVHTRDEVVPAVERLAALEGVAGDMYVLLRTAAFYHDLGFIDRYESHEEASAEIARRSLPRFGYGEAEIEMIVKLIMATKLPQLPQSLPEKILADADLDILGREDFLARNAALRAELAAFRAPIDDASWYVGQIFFLRGHRYFTESARRLRDAKKRENLERLGELLAACRERR
jgi:uncharacterized protein